MNLADMFGANDADWMTGPHRNCASPADAHPPDVRLRADRWHPNLPHVLSDKKQRAYRNLARKLCGGCPEIANCLQHALDNPRESGIWGGTTEAQRDRLQKRGAGNAA